MSLSRIAILSDIHGNRWALEAVLEDIESRSVDMILDLGDKVYGPLDPAGTASILMDKAIPGVAGNQDRVILKPDPGERPATLDFVQKELTDEQLSWLGEFQTTMQIDSFFLCHGTPDHDETYLLQKVEGQGAVLRTCLDIHDTLSNVKSPIILCGHDHVPRTMSLPIGQLIVNPGSVGLPAYIDEYPSEHAMETGTSHARYAIMSQTKNGWLVEDIAVPYDWQTAVKAALKNGRPDWAVWLETGRA